MKTLRIALAQINPTAGDIKNNSVKIVEYIEKAKAHSADIVVFPELSITGYPPDDLLLDKSFLKNSMSHLNNIIPHTAGIVAIVGFADPTDNRLYNAAGIIANGQLIHIYRKRYLTKSPVFDDTKYFNKGKLFPIYNHDGIAFQVVFGNELEHLDNSDTKNVDNDSPLVISIDASCYFIDKITGQENIITSIASKQKRHIAYLNLVGSQDEWVFEGNSFISDKKGKIISRSPLFEEDLLLADIELDEDLNTMHPNVNNILLPGKLNSKKQKIPNKQVNTSEQLEEIYNALVLGTKDYVRKNGFNKVALGLSGGIDSALVAVIAVDALGGENVAGVSMPTRFTSEESKTDAREIAKNLNIQFIEVPIDTLYDAYLTMFTPIFKNKPPSQLTQENIQPRIRANILMALSNNFGWLVLATGNKSEVGSGYSTLYGDTAGGFAVIKDVSKTLVYELTWWINKKAGQKLIPERILTKAPSAELKHNQKDTDTLPPYEILDPIMKAHIEDNKTIEEITATGHDSEFVKEIINTIRINEYKRRQSPIGIKITKKSFGKDRNFPITNRYIH